MKKERKSTFPLVVVESTEGLNTSPLNNTRGFMSEKDFTADVNLKKINN